MSNHLVARKRQKNLKPHLVSPSSIIWPNTTLPTMLKQKINMFRKKYLAEKVIILWQIFVPVFIFHDDIYQILLAIKNVIWNYQYFYYNPQHFYNLSFWRLFAPGNNKILFMLISAWFLKDRYKNMLGFNYSTCGRVSTL